MSRLFARFSCCRYQGGCEGSRGPCCRQDEAPGVRGRRWHDQGTALPARHRPQHRHRHRTAGPGSAAAPPGACLRGARSRCPWRPSKPSSCFRGFPKTQLGRWSWTAGACWGSQQKGQLSELYFVAVWVGVIVWKRRVKLVRLLHLRHFIMKGFRIVFFL